MGFTTDIFLNYQNEEDAGRGFAVTENVIKLFMMLQCGQLDDVDEEIRKDVLLLYRLSEKRLRDFCADDYARDYYRKTLGRLELWGSHITLGRCGTLQRWLGTVHEQYRSKFFYALCLIHALATPQTPFEAIYRYEMTVTGAVEKIWCTYDCGDTLRMEAVRGERPFDENDRTNAQTAAWSLAKYRDLWAVEEASHEQ